MENQDIAFWAVIIAIFASVLVAIYDIKKEADMWNKFSFEHNCHQINSRSETETAGYLCDDGVIYIR